MQDFQYAFFNHKIDNLENAKVSIMTNALQYGTGIFGGIRGYYDSEQECISIFRLYDHYKRLLSSIKLLGCGFNYNIDELMNTTVELVKINIPSCNLYIRPFAYIGNTSLGPNLYNVTLDFAIYMIKLEEYMPLTKGLSLMISSWRRVSANAIPPRGKFSGAYLNSALARKEANDNGYDEAILLTESGHVAEGSAENIFIVKDGILITPPVYDDILEGITRATIIKIGEDSGLKVIERTIDRSELYIADEVFLSGTGCQIAWVNAIDKRCITKEIGVITKMIQEKYFLTVYGKFEAYKNWCTKFTINK